MASNKSLLTWARRHDMSIYTRNAGPTISGLMAKASALESKRVSLEGEIDLVRATLIRTVEAWNLALESENAGEEVKLMAEKLIREAAEYVSKLVQAQAKVRILDQGALQMTSVSWVVAEVCRAIEEEVREQAGEEVANDLVKRIRKIKLPEDETLSKFVKAQSDEKFL